MRGTFAIALAAMLTSSMAARAVQHEVAAPEWPASQAVVRSSNALNRDRARQSRTVRTPDQSNVKGIPEASRAGGQASIKKDSKLGWEAGNA